MLFLFFLKGEKMSTEITTTVEVNAFEANQLYAFYKDLYKRQKESCECLKRIINDVNMGLDEYLDKDLLEMQYEESKHLVNTYKLGYEKWLIIRDSHF